jgi:hypothetical protein
MQGIKLFDILNCPLIGIRENGTLIHIMAINTHDGIKLFERDPMLYPDNERITKSVQSISFQYSEESKRYKYLQDIGTPLKNAMWDCKTEEEKQLLVLSQNPHITHNVLEAIESEIQFMKNSGIKYKQSKAKCTNNDERTLLSLNTQKINMKNKIARAMVENSINLPHYSFMESYKRLVIMNESLYFDGIKLLRHFREQPKFDTYNNLVKYILPRSSQNIFELILNAENNIQLASPSERELIICLSEWSSSIQLMPSVQTEVINLPKELIYNTYLCMTCNDSTDISNINNVIPKCKICNKSMIPI